MRQGPQRWRSGGTSGGILTNAWDRRARRAAARVFPLEPVSFEARHNAVVQEFECGRLTLDAYVACVAFDEPLSLLRRVAASRRHRMVMCNNESRELNRYRIERFELTLL